MLTHLSEGSWVPPLVRQRLNLLPLQLDISSLDAMPHHDIRHVVIPLGAEESGSNGSQHMPSHQSSCGESFSLDSLFGNLIVDRNVVLLLEDDNGESVVWAPFLSSWRKPGKKHLIFREVR